MALRRINERFVNGHPSNYLAEAGVLVRQNDALTRYRSEVPDLWSVGSWDRLATSIVSARLPHMYSTSAEGTILSPSALQGAVLCAYPRDGNSMSQLCEEGTRRAAPHLHRPDDLKGMLAEHESKFVSDESDLSCLWVEGGEDPKDRSQCRYNEVVLSADQYHSSLPSVVEAFFYPVNGPVHRREGNPIRAKRAHAAFVSYFAAVAGVGKDGHSVPLLAFDVSLARRGMPPFSISVL